jgi:Flp pilus assembly protein CpaB
MRSRRRLWYAIVAGVIAAGLFTVVLVQAYATKNTSAAAPQMVSAVVAKVPLNAGTKLDATNVALGAIPASTLIPGVTLTDANVAIGKFTSVPLSPGQPVLANYLLSDAPSASNSVTRAPLPIDPGYEAMSVPFDPNQDVGGYIQPEDHIDILVTTSDGVVHYGFQDVRVLRVNAPPSSTASSAAATSCADASSSQGTLVVELTPEKAAALSYIYSSACVPNVRFVLRPSAADKTGPLANSGAVGPSNWRQYLDG